MHIILAIVAVNLGQPVPPIHAPKPVAVFLGQHQPAPRVPSVVVVKLGR